MSTLHIHTTAAAPHHDKNFAIITVWCQAGYLKSEVIQWLMCKNGYTQADALLLSFHILIGTINSASAMSTPSLHIYYIQLSSRFPSFALFTNFTDLHIL